MSFMLFSNSNSIWQNVGEILLILISIFVLIAILFAVFKGIGLIFKLILLIAFILLLSMLIIFIANNFFDANWLNGFLLLPNKAENFLAMMNILMI